MMARQQTLKQAFAAVGRKTKAPTRMMRQSTLNFDGCAPALRDDDSDDGDCSDEPGVCGGDHTAELNAEYICICNREGCDFEADPESCNCNSCWEQRIDHDLSLCALRPGYFHDLEESAFADSVMESSQWTHQWLEYYDNICKPKDLKRFVQQRGLRDAYLAGLTLKYYYIKELATADNSRVFRFLDLPPELRNEVYGYLLAPMSHYSRYAGVLGTCKAINKEATEILYADNVIPCSLWSQQKAFHINNHRHYGDAALELIRLPTAVDHYPSFLARVRNLRIEITIDIPAGGPSFPRNATADFVRSWLLALASIVMDGGRLRTLEVNLQGKNPKYHPLEPEVVASILYPLRRLRNVEAKFSGNHDIPESLRESMVADMRLQDPVFNTLKHCRLVLSDAEAYMSLVNLLDPLPTDYTQRGGKSRAAVIARQVRYLQSQMANGQSLFADWLGEVKVQTYLAKLQEQLAEVFPDRMKEMVESMGKTTGDRVEYQQTEHQRWSIRDLARAKSPSPDPAPL